MANNDWFFSLFLTVLLVAVALSLYLWLVKRARSGLLLWIAYGIRALCGLTIFSAGLVAWELLSSEVALSAVAPFAGLFFLVGTLCMVPWGAFLRKVVVSH